MNLDEMVFLKRLWHYVRLHSMSIIHYLIKKRYIVMGILEVAMLAGIFSVFIKKIYDLQISIFALFLSCFAIWSVGVIVKQVFNKSIRNIENFGRHISVFLTILIISLGLMTGISVLISNRAFVSIPDLSGGTFGFRTWKCNVSLEDIKISYQDSLSNKWIDLDSCQIYDINNWVKDFDQNEQNRDTLWIEDAASVKSKTQGQSNTPRIYVGYCGAFFNLPRIGHSPNVSNATLQAVVVFHDVSKSHEDNPNIEFNIRVPWDEKNRKPSSQLYVGLQSFFYHPNWSKCWIPALNLAPSSLHNDSSELLKKNVNFSKFRYDVRYELKAVWFDEYVSLYVVNIKTGISGTLYEGKISPGQIFIRNNALITP